MIDVRFSFENLEVWRKGISFCKDVIDLTEIIETDRKHYRLIEQLEAASTSIPANIAEGSGRYSRKEFVHFLYIARGSLYEVITFLTIFHEKKWIDDITFKKMKSQGVEISKMTSKLISSIKTDISNDR